MATDLKLSVFIQLQRKAKNEPLPVMCFTISTHTIGTANDPFNIHKINLQ